MTNKKDIYLTEDGLAEVCAELDYLKQTKRPEVITALKEARALGDLSENAEYAAARDEQAIIEGKIVELEHMVENAKIIEKGNINEVNLGTTVKIKYVADDETEEYKIVGSQEADPFENKISNDSPIARAILGLKKGSVVTVESPNGKYQIEVVEIY